MPSSSSSTLAPAQGRAQGPGSTGLGPSSGCTAPSSSGALTPDRLRSSSSDPPASSPAASAAPLILRIKRKRDAEPVDALMIDALLASADGTGEQGAGGTTGEVKAAPGDKMGQELPKRALKKRLTERFEPQARDAGGAPSEGRGVFRLAETVSIESFNDPAATFELQRRMAHRAPRHSAPGSSIQAIVSPIRTTATSASPSAASKGSAAALEFRLVRPTPLPKAASNLPKSSTSSGASSGHTQPSPMPSPSGSTSLRAPKARSGSTRLADRMLRNQNSSGSLKRRALKQPPQIMRARKTPAHSMRIIDAVAVSSGLKAGGSGMERKKKRKAGGKETVKPAAKADADMEMLDQRFADLLGDYLKEKNLEPPRDLRSSGTLPGTTMTPDSDEESSETEGEEEADSDSEYVYDVYYRDRSHATWGSGPGGAVEVGLQPSTVAGHESDMTSSQSSLSRGSKSLIHQSTSGIVGGASVPAELQQVQPQAMARIVGLSASDVLLLQTTADDDASWERILSEEYLDDADLPSGARGSSLAGVGKGSDEDWDEGEDEDSNDESFYRNDYPEHDVDEEEQGQGLEDSDDEEEEELEGWDTWRSGKGRKAIGRGRVVIDSDDEDD